MGPGCMTNARHNTDRSIVQQFANGYFDPYQLAIMLVPIGISSR